MQLNCIKVNSIESSISSKTEFIILDIDNLDSYDVNKIFINAKIRYKLNVILMHNANLKTCIIPFMYDTLFPKESVLSKRQFINGSVALRHHQVTCCFF